MKSICLLPGLIVFYKLQGAKGKARGKKEICSHIPNICTSTAKNNAYYG